MGFTPVGLGNQRRISKPLPTICHSIAHSEMVSLFFPTEWVPIKLCHESNHTTIDLQIMTRSLRMKTLAPCTTGAATDTEKDVAMVTAIVNVSPAMKQG